MKEKRETIVPVVGGEFGVSPTPQLDKGLPFGKVNKANIDNAYKDIPAATAMKAIVDKITPQALGYLSSISAMRRDLLTDACEVIAKDAGLEIQVEKTVQDIHERVKKAQNRAAKFGQELMQGDSFETLNGTSASRFLKNKM